MRNGVGYGRAVMAAESDRAEWQRVQRETPRDVRMHGRDELAVRTRRPDGGIRDGARALELARRVFEQQQSIDHAETIAMALAEVGNFAEAVEWQQQVVEQRRRQGAGARLEASRGYLELFRQGEGVRAPWMEGG